MNGEVRTRDELSFYLRGAVAVGLPEKAAQTIEDYADAIAREAVEAARDGHAFFNNRGGNLVCLVCWLDRDAAVHR